MADEKKGFLLYSDMIHTVKKMPKEKAGELFLTILEYVNDENPEPEDILVSVAFEPVKQQLKRDLRLWEKKAGKKSTNGITGNLKRWHPDLFEQVESGKISIEEAETEIINRKTSPCDNSDRKNRKAIKKIANVAVNDNVNDNVSINRANALVADKSSTQEKALKNEYSELIKNVEGKETKEIYGEVKYFIETKKPLFIEPYVDAWNIIAGIHKLPEIKMLTDKRRSKIRTRISKGGLDFFKVIAVIRKDPFYRGESGGWKVTFDHIIESDDNWAKIQEKYSES